LAIFADGNGHFNVGFSGMHAYVDAFSEYNAINGFIGSSSQFVGQIVDYLVTDKFQSGYQYKIVGSVSGAGNSAHHPLGQGEDYTSSVNFGISSAGGTGTCSGPQGGELSGSFTTTCTVFIPLSQLATQFQMTLFGMASSDDGQATFDALNTATIDSIQVVDKNGNIVPDIQIYDRSGYDYNASSTTPSTVPEPASAVLVVTGFAILIGFAKECPLTRRDMRRPSSRATFSGYHASATSSSRKLAQQWT